jgi:hypothetical protein
MSFRAVLFPSSLSKKEQCVISVEETSYTTDKIRENTKFLKDEKKGELRGEKKKAKEIKKKWIKETEKRSVNMYSTFTNNTR